MAWCIRFLWSHEEHTYQGPGPGGQPGAARTSVSPVWADFPIVLDPMTNREQPRRLACGELVLTGSFGPARSDGKPGKTFAHAQVEFS